MEQKLTLRKDTSTYTLKDIREEIQECVELIAALGYPELLKNDYTVEFSTRRVKNYGTCQQVGHQSFKIVLNQHYVELASADNVHNTICHEVLHSIPNCMNHGYKWQVAAAKVNRAYSSYSRIERLGHDENYSKAYSDLHREPYRYKIICDNCDKSWRYKRMCNIVKDAPLGLCKCPYCKKSKFRVENI